MKALTLDARPARWMACKSLGMLHTPIYWSALSNLRYREIPVPDRPGPEWLRLRTVLGGICGTDLAVITQRTHPASILRPFTSFPIVLGHENVAVIDEIGESAGAVTAGTRVVVEPALSCIPRGVDPPCTACARGLFSLCEHFVGTPSLPAGTMIGLNAFTGGSWAPYFVAHRSQLHPIPDDLTDEQAVLIDPLACSLHAVLRRPPQPGERVLVQGSGIIAIGVVLALRALGLDNPIVALCRHSLRAERMTLAGASTVVRTARKAPRARMFDDVAAAFDTRRISSILGNHALLGGADVVYECTGTGLGLSDAIKFAAARGTVVAAGTSQITLVDTTCLWFREVTVIGAYGRQIEFPFEYAAKRSGGGGQVGEPADAPAGTARHTYALVMELMRRGRLPTDGLLTHVFDVADYRRALRTLTGAQRSQVIKAAFRHPAAH